MIFAAPVLAKSHISDELLLNVVVAVVYKLLESGTVKVEIQLLLIVIGKLRIKRLIDQLLITVCNFFRNRLSIVSAVTDIALGKQYTSRAISPLPQKAVLFIILSNI